MGRKGKERREAQNNADVCSWSHIGAINGSLVLFAGSVAFKSGMLFHRFIVLRPSVIKMAAIPRLHSNKRIGSPSFTNVDSY